MPMANVRAAWIAFLLGTVAGAVQGLFFAREDWLGGYASWPRRLTRLGHVSFFGLGLLNLGFAWSAEATAVGAAAVWPSRLLIGGLCSMPAVCYGSAWVKPLRHLFVVPVGCVLTGIAVFLWEIWR